MESGLRWYEYGRLTSEKLRTPLSTTFAFVATHNHFAVDRGGKVFNRSAPVIKLAAETREDDYLRLLGLLNSSTACFWMKQIFYPKGGDQVGNKGARVSKSLWEDRYEFAATGLEKFPLAQPYPLDLGRRLDTLAQTFALNLPAAVVEAGVPTRVRLYETRLKVEATRAEMIALQEELDWRCYRLYGLMEEDLEHPEPPPLRLGERAFEIVMARQMEAGGLETAWFERHRSRPMVELPAHWPDDYRMLVERRIALIESDRFIGLIERPEYKRRWALEPWEKMEAEALRRWLLARLEKGHYWPSDPALKSTNRLADLAHADSEFMQVAELYTGRPDFDVSALVGDLVTSESVPFLLALRYNESGLRKRAQWEATWVLQRKEDAIDALTKLPEDDPSRRTHAQAKALKAKEVGDIPVPPKYRTADFQRTDYWRLRGGLDVPKERFVSYPFCERDADGSLVVTWAGFDHLQQARALATYYLERKDREGWPPERLVPLLAGVRELLPWLHQWHNAYDPALGARMGDWFSDFVRDEARGLGLTEEDLAAWTPPARASRRGRRPRQEAAE